jgi:hypothetical protein
MSREHVFPRWLAALFEDGGPVEMHRIHQTKDDRQTAVHTARLFDHTVKDFCEVCNTGWMHDLEEEARRIVTPMVRGQAVVLDAREQDIIAIWATKTILAAGMGMGGGRLSLPPESYSWFGRHRRPLPGSVVWIGRYEGKGEQWPISFHQHGISLTRVSDAAEFRDNLHSACAIGHLVLFLFVAEIPGEGPLVTGSSGRNRTLVWPVTGGSGALHGKAVSVSRRIEPG